MTKKDPHGIKIKYTKLGRFLKNKDNSLAYPQNYIYFRYLVVVTKSDPQIRKLNKITGFTLTKSVLNNLD